MIKSDYPSLIIKNNKGNELLHFIEYCKDYPKENDKDADRKKCNINHNETVLAIESDNSGYFLNEHDLNHVYNFIHQIKLNLEKQNG